jgi:DNA (cytosine-5)-methyltransferase 1
MGRQDFETETLIAHSLCGDGFDASEDGTGRGTPLVPIAIQGAATRENESSGPDGVGVRTDGIAYTLEARSEVQSIAFNLRGREGGAMPECDELASIRAASGGSSRSYVAGPLGAGDGNRGWRNDLDQGAFIPIQGMAVRRLTPEECEALQGFPRGYTKISDKTADGPRYKALGNSFAVPVVQWIGRRIMQAEELTK